MRTVVLLAAFFALAACASSAQDVAATKATFDAGVAAYDAKDYAKAYDLFASIDDRDLAAMRNVALMLRKGEGVAKDPKAAEEMYARAASGGLATAAADLGEMLLKGEAGPPDPKAALPWLAGAADAGHPVAAFELAQMYEQGNGVAKDLGLARKLYQASADAGYDAAKQRLATLPPP
ncbi:MAG: sel1 repeat family protein [Alphaproteobacteria bacterium]|nr:sel1 repeat family protein [Alphaproteobacteria bacterium]